MFAQRHEEMLEAAIRNSIVRDYDEKVRKPVMIGT